MFIDKVTTETIDGKIFCTRHQTKTRVRPALANEGAIHFPFCRGIEKIQLFAGRDISGCRYRQCSGIHDRVGFTRMVQISEYAQILDMVMPSNLNGLIGWLVRDAIPRDMMDQLATFIRFIRYEPSAISTVAIFNLEHRDTFLFLTCPRGGRYAKSTSG